MKKSDSIVFINQDSGYLMIDIVNHYDQTLIETILITGRLVERGTKLNDKVKIAWITAYKRNTLISKFTSWLIGFFQILYIVGFKYRKSRLFIVSNPPFAVFVPLFFRRRFSVLIFDIYPDALTNSISWFKYTPFNAIWSYLNKIVFKKAECVYTIGEGLKESLKKYTVEGNVKVVPLWTDNNFIFMVPRNQNIFLKGKSFENKFVVLYSGNLGKTQHPEIVLNLANYLKHQHQIHFVIIGAGSEKFNLENRIQTERIANVSMFDWQEPNMLSHTFSSAHIAIVSSGSEVNNLSIPSKTFNFMSVGVPILGITSKQSELGNLIKEYQLGESFGSSEIEHISQFILSLKDNSEVHLWYSQNSFNASKLFSKENVRKFI